MKNVIQYNAVHAFVFSSFYYPYLMFFNTKIFQLFEFFHFIWPNLSLNILHSAVVFPFFGLACFICISSKCNRGKE